jgi:rhamnulose-1-phosphate aldolase
MREIAEEPHKYILGIYIFESGSEYKFFNFNKQGEILDSLPDKQPTSELLTHIAYHNLLCKKGSKSKSLLHTHSTEIIALTQIKDYTNENNLNEVLFNMHPEVKLFIPEGAGLVPFMDSGSDEIANATLRKANEHRVVIWEKHGCIAAEESLTGAFELIDIITKSAKIFFLSKNFI